MYIKNVKIKNFRCFDDISLEFKQRFNLLKGINGKGKTTMLEALAIGLNSFPECINKESFSMSISDDDIREQYNSYRKGSYSCNRLLKQKQKTQWSKSLAMIKKDHEVFLIDKSFFCVR